MTKDRKNSEKYTQILDALQRLLERKDIQSISVSEIAREAGIGKGSIYYYFSSKDAIFDALVERNYEKPLETAKNLSRQTEISPTVRMAMLFQACRNSSSELKKQNQAAGKDISSDTLHENAYIHQKYLNHLIVELKPVLTEILRQGIECGELKFDYPEALAEIVLIILSVKIDNTIIPSSPKEIESTIRGLISLLEKGAENKPGALNYLMSW